MTFDLRSWQQQKAKIESINQRAERAAGALEQLRSQLQDYECKDEADAKKVIASLQKEEIVLEKKLTKAVAEFQKEWADKLGG